MAPVGPHRGPWIVKIYLSIIFSQYLYLLLRLYSKMMFESRHLQNYGWGKHLAGSPATQVGLTLKFKRSMKSIHPLQTFITYEHFL